MLLSLNISTGIQHDSIILSLEMGWLVIFHLDTTRANKALTKAELETSVMLHEMGHLLGLGNPEGAALNSRRSKNRHGHCNNKMCLMYSSTETRNLWVIKQRGKVPGLDKECLRSLEDIRHQGDVEEPAGRASRIPAAKLN